MLTFLTEPKVTSLVVKVAARCNINCDYCYVFKHADQSYKKQPRLLNKVHIAAIAKQVNAYLLQTNIETMGICLHGGEPLLAGVDYLEDFFRTFHQWVESKDRLRFVIQTNGVLLSKNFLELFKKYQVGVSVSLDGPPSANDKHRLDHRGRSTYEKVFNAITLLKEDYKELFLGIISVIDPTNSPEEILDFFAAIDPPSYDLLFPDANHFVAPPGRELHANLYSDWIKKALHYWYTTHRKLPLRMFSNVYQAILGIPPESEFFGNGSISYLVIETDGSYHYSDLLKATYEGASHTGLHVESASIQEVLKAPVIQSYQSKLQMENQCVSCIKCPEFSICGSGQIAHRYGPKGFNHPTVYCREMLAMIHQARHLIFKDKAAEMMSNPELYTKEIVAAFLSDYAVHLLGVMIKEEVSVDLEINSASLHMLGNDYPTLQCRLINEIESKDFFKKDPEAKHTLQAALKHLQMAFPCFIREAHFISSSLSSQEIENRIERLYEQVALMENDQSACLYLPLQTREKKSLNSLDWAELILHEVLKAKLSIFNQHYPLVQPSLGSSPYYTEQAAAIKAFELAYRLAHSYRLWQNILALNSDKNIYHRLKQAKDLLLEALSHLEAAPLSRVGKEFLCAIADDFLPSQMSFSAST
ncbi:FxsB family cyclophane-forming radical SAM/SPASM peptide maturase [Parachlamydia sp. AcF125]|uniref:FxsB family cyclophane-forming radical SAM/SPASM peptide maturase n=1 Tax=Parachlamydia sp. AcF125 TaxID=2795736 RepID=UPI001BCA00FA|nr:FxsB family cyclophane-forming radical SAM/SPASM peptide maturase [Parachlamydia sp. AcF125]MBS4167770.1 Anaerobic sulfatase-maturating enzyme [Parachlamydia sp. AcF125]